MRFNSKHPPPLKTHTHTHTQTHKCVDPKSHAVAYRPLRRVDNQIKGVVSRVTHAPACLVAKRLENTTPCHSVAEPGFVLTRSTPNGPMPRKEGDSGAISKISTHDGSNVRDDVVARLEDGYAGYFARMKHHVAHLFAARQSSHPSEHEPHLHQSIVPQARSCRERTLASQLVVPNSSTERDGSSRLLLHDDSL